MSSSFSFGLKKSAKSGDAESRPTRPPPPKPPQGLFVNSREDGASEEEEEENIVLRGGVSLFGEGVVQESLLKEETPSLSAWGHLADGDGEGQLTEDGDGLIQRDASGRVTVKAGKEKEGLERVEGGLVVLKSKQGTSDRAAVEGPSRYIGSLILHGKKREVEQEIIQEKVLKKERQKDVEQFGDKPVFVTSAYAKRLEERKAIETALREQERDEAMNSVANRKDLTDFHRQFLLKGLSSRNHAASAERSAASRSSHEAGAAAREISAATAGGEERACAAAGPAEAVREVVGTAKGSGESESAAEEEVMKTEMEQGLPAVAAKKVRLEEAVDAEEQRVETIEPPQAPEQRKPTVEEVEAKRQSVRERYLQRKRQMPADDAGR